MKCMKVLAILALGVAANTAMAGFTLTGLSGNSGGAVGSVDNTILTHNHAGAEFIPGDITISGDLTVGIAGTYASEARIQFRNPGGQAGNTPALTTQSSYTGTITIAPFTVTGASAIFTGTSVGNWEFELYESYDDGAGADSIWSNLSIDIQDGSPPPPPAPPFGGDFLSTPNTLAYNVEQAATTVWDDMNPQPGLTDGAGEDGAGTLYASATFDNLGNEVGFKINHPGGDLIVDLFNLTTDLDLHLLTAGGTPADAIGTSDNGGTTAENVTVLDAPAGMYFAVVDTYGSTNAGSTFSILYTPEPASLAFLALGGLALLRRR